MSYETIEYEVRDDGVALLTLNRPRQRNPLSVRMREELASLMPRIGHDAAVKALVVTGAGDNFCGGGDISGMRKPFGPSNEKTSPRSISRSTPRSASNEP